MDTVRLERTIEHIVSLLIAGRYEDIERLSGKARLSDQELRTAVAEYGRTLTMPKEGKLKPDVISINGSIPPQWSVVVPLHTIEEGESDLSLDLVLTDTGLAEYAVIVEDLHVR